MIEPVIFSLHIGTFTFALRWYGVLVMLGVAVSAWFAECEVKRHGERGQIIWDALIWLLPAGIIGARLWYVVTATLGGNSYYLDNPIQILNIPQGGLHIYGGLLLGGLVIFFFARHHKIDIWLFLESSAPTVLLGQAIARPANFINQELYGQPTKSHWGIPIDTAHRIDIYKDLTQYPLKTTPFQPTFAYEMLWIFLAFALIMYLADRFADRLKLGAFFFAWLVLAGLGRFLIEFFRPDQPHLANSWLSFTQIATIAMILIGLFMLAFRFGIFKLSMPILPEKYQIAEQSV